MKHRKQKFSERFPNKDNDSQIESKRLKLKKPDTYQKTIEQVIYRPNQIEKYFTKIKDNHKFQINTELLIKFLISLL